MTEALLKELRKRIRESEHMVFFGGAGMSTASGSPDFRGQAGLYTVSEEESPE